MKLLKHNILDYLACHDKTDDGWDEGDRAGGSLAPRVYRHLVGEYDLEVVDTLFS